MAIPALRQPAVLHTLLLPHWFIPSVPSDLTGTTITGNRRYSSGTVEGPLLLLLCHSGSWRVFPTFCTININNIIHITKATRSLVHCPNSWFTIHPHRLLICFVLLCVDAVLWCDGVLIILSCARFFVLYYNIIGVLYAPSDTLVYVHTCQSMFSVIYTDHAAGSGGLFHFFYLP